jgi:phage gpG-like protein
MTKPSIEVIWNPIGSGIIESIRTKIPTALAIALNDETTIMRARIEEGRDVNDQPFDPYSDEYAEWRESKGYRVSPPNLTVTGNMLNSIASTVNENTTSFEGVVFFSDAAEAEKAKYNLEKREFFGFTDEQVNRIRDRLLSVIED